MTTEQRLQRLERQGRLYRHLFILAALGLVAALTYGATKPIPNVIQARRFEAVNRHNKVVATLRNTIFEDGRLSIYGPKGVKEYISASIVEGFGGHLIVSGVEGKSAASISGNVDAKTGGYIEVKNKTGEEVVQLSVDEYGNGKVWAGNRKGMGRTLRPGPQ